MTGPKDNDGRFAGRLAGRRVLVTGGASGIGRASARLFAQAGARVAILDCNISGAEAVAAEISGAAFGCDVSSESAVMAAVAAAASALGGIDGVLNAAAIATSERIPDASLESWQKVISINLNGTFLVCREAI